MKSLFIFFLLTVVLLTMPTASNATTTYIPVGDEIYPLLDRLEAQGVITSGLLNTRPINRAEAERLLREAETSDAAEQPFVREMIASLRRRLGPSTADSSKTGYGASLYIRYINTDTALPTLQFNNDGDKPSKGANYRTGMDLRIENAGPLAIDVNPEYRTRSEPEDEEVIHHGYAVIGLSKIDMALGKDAQWWGPGRHGAILLTNNAEPFTMVRFTNPEPIVLPWILKHLGDFRFAFFATKLERDRNDISEPYLWGMRFDFKPIPNVEVGLQRTAILGGRNGRKDDLATWGKSIFPFGRADNTGTLADPGDQRAGFDLTWTIPAKLQTVQLYLEGDGEDMHIAWPNLWAWVGGVYLPRIASLDRLDFRFEFGTTMGRRLNPVVWYGHWLYTDGYTYNDRIIGHHIGTDSRDLYFEFSYHLPEHDARFFLAYDQEGHHMREGDFKEIDHEGIAGADIALTRHIGLTATYAHAWVRNAGNQFSPTQQINNVNGLVRYTF